MSERRPALVGEVQEFTQGRWRTVHLGERVRVKDRRRVAYDMGPTFGPASRAEGDPLGGWLNARVDAGLPDDVLEFRDAGGRVLGRFQIPDS